MKTEQIYTGCLSQATYYVVSDGEAIIIDPLREIKPYLKRLANDGVKLKYILETHFHADFVSGHLDLAKKTGVPIIYGPEASMKQNCFSARDGEIFKFGKAKVKVIHTPGHTLESSCFLVIDENGKDHALFSGDTLFIGDVGRPDLAQKREGMDDLMMSRLLYKSLREKIMPLADNIILYPGHGAGSACGKNMSDETVSTLGEQKKNNYALRTDMTEMEFITEVNTGLSSPPAYFNMNAALNKHGYPDFEDVLKKGLQELDADAFVAAADKECLIVDSRKDSEFCKGFIPKSVNIGIDGNFAPWAGMLIANVKQPIVFVSDPGREEETITRLSRVGFDNLFGHLKGGFRIWELSGKEVDRINSISAAQFAVLADTQKDLIIDVRSQKEYNVGHVQNAVNKPLEYINDWFGQLDAKQFFYLYCAAGYRSMAVASILQARGLRNFTEIEGGFNAISRTSVPKTYFASEFKAIGSGKTE